MEKVILEAKERKQFGKSSLSILRREGKVPAVYYSKHDKPIHLEVVEKTIKPFVFTSETHLIAINLEGHEEHECIIKDVQFDPLTDRILHFDLLGLTKGEKFQLEVPVQLHGSPVGVKEGGIVQQLLHKLEVECLPKDIPQHIDINIAELKIGDSIHIEDISIPEVTILNPEDSVIVSIVHPKIEKEPTPEEEAEGAELEESAEPEVIAKGKGEEEAEEE